MTNAVLLEKLYAGNPHVRFDEGEVALAATQRRGSLLYRIASTAVLAVMMATTAVADETIVIDFTNRKGPIKPLNGICNVRSPITPGEDGKTAELREIAELAPSYVRFHDMGGAFGSKYVDIPNVFPDMDADESDPANYDFAFTDHLVEAVVAAGAKPYYRLGVTIENYYGAKAYRIYPPKDKAKYARVCERVVAHYIDGWASGFRYDMKHWEFWCEPENRMLWLGGRKEFFEFYAIVARTVKAKHPDIKFGGYGACRFDDFEGLDVNSTSCRQNWLGWFEDFCAFVKENDVPFDFFSWHLYRADPNRYAWHARDVRDRLDRHGLSQVEAHLTEWGKGGQLGGLRENETLVVGAYVAACLSEFQKLPIDLATLYAATPGSMWCPLFTKFGDQTPAYYAFKSFGLFRRLGTSCAVSDVPRKRIYALAATDGKDKAFMLTNDALDVPRVIDLDIRGADGAKWNMYRLDRDHPDFQKVLTPLDLVSVYLPPKGVLLLTTGEF